MSKLERRHLDTLHQILFSGFRVLGYIAYVHKVKIDRLCESVALGDSVELPSRPSLAVSLSHRAAD